MLPQGCASVTRQLRCIFWVTLFSDSLSGARHWRALAAPAHAVALVASEVQDESMSRQRDPEVRHIVVIRHAKSSWDDPPVADHDRPLSKRGRNALSRLRDHIEGLELRPDLVMCSSSRRTRETLAGIRPALGRKARVESDRALYGAGAEQLVTELRRLDDQVTNVFLIGHNPGVADLVDLLAADSVAGVAAIDTRRNSMRSFRDVFRLRSRKCGARSNTLAVNVSQGHYPPVCEPQLELLKRRANRAR